MPATIAQDPIFTGEKSARIELVGDGHQAYIKQTVTGLTIGQPYLFSAWIRTEAWMQGDVALVAFLGSTEAEHARKSLNATHPPPDSAAELDWVQVVLVFTAPEATMILALAHDGAIPDEPVSDFVWFDHAHFAATTSSDDVDSTLEVGLIDVHVVDAFNRFARRGDAFLDDPDGVKALEYPDLTPVELWVRRTDEEAYLRRFGGFTVNAERAGQSVRIELLSHDYWLKHRDVYRDYTAESMLSILEDLITTLTPLTWDASLVTVENDVPITKVWRAERLDRVISEISTRSSGEEYGADDDGRFYFRPRSESSSPRNFTDGEHVEAEFSQDFKREVNRVVLFYGSGASAGAVILEDTSRQLELQEQIGSPRPVIVERTTSYPEILTEDEAIKKAQAILADRATIQTGSLRSWEAFDVYPGDVALVEAPDEGIAGDFRVAAIEYWWLKDATYVTLAENAEGVLDVLVGMTDEITRIDNRAADPDVAPVQVMALEATLLDFDVEIKIWSRTVPDSAFVWGAFRGGWGDPLQGGGVWGDQRGALTLLVDE